MTKHVYRSSEQAIIAGIIGVIGCGVAVGMLLEARKMAGLIFVIVYFAVLLPVIVRLALSRVTASESGVHVVNIFSSRKLSWEDIEKFEIGPWKVFPYVCLIRLRDGRVEHAFGIQERANFADGSGEKLAGELNAELRGHAARFGGRQEASSRADRDTETEMRVYRSGAQVLGGVLMGFFGALLGIALLLEAEQVRGVVLAAIYLVAVISICGRLANARLVATETGVSVSNVFSNVHLRWADIERFEIGRWNLFPYVFLIRLRSGDIKHAFAIQERTNFPDGSGEEMVNELNSEVRKRHMLTQQSSA